MLHRRAQQAAPLGVPPAEVQLAETVLDKILEVRRRRVEEARVRVPLPELERAAQARTDYRDFSRAIRREGLSIIAELKAASPSAGVLRADYQPAAIARGYEAAGSAALSVLTEEDFFKGSLDHLRAVRQAAALPILRKDFIVDDYQVYESAAAGADAILLIVAALAEDDLRRLNKLAQGLKLAALVEVHTMEEAAQAVRAGAAIIGVNNRNLQTLEVDLEASLRLRGRIPSWCDAVSESGIKTAADLVKLSKAGYDAVLIGERFMTQPDPGKALAGLLAQVPEAARAQS